MTNNLEQRICARAYEIWEQAGRPHGLEQAHWEQAAREIEAEPQTDAAKANGPEGTPASPGKASARTKAATVSAAPKRSRKP